MWGGGKCISVFKVFHHARGSFALNVWPISLDVVLKEGETRL